MNIDERQEEIIEAFSLLDDWMEKYEYIIDLGQQLPVIDPKFQIEENVVKGCQSTVWVHADLVDGKMKYSSYSDTTITRGMIAMILKVLDGLPPENVVKSDLYFVDKIGLKANLSLTRANGLMSIINRMKQLAASSAS